MRQAYDYKQRVLHHIGEIEPNLALDLPESMLEDACELFPGTSAKALAAMLCDAYRGQRKIL